MKLDTKLAEIFDLAEEEYKTIPTDVVVIENTEIVDNTSPQEKIDSDYIKIRNNLYELLTQGQTALTDALAVAKGSENPRAYEVAGNLMMQLADINNQIMALHQNKQKIDAPKKGEPEKQVINNSLNFHGTSEELSKMITNLTQRN